MSQFKINEELIDRIKKLISSEDKSKLIEKLKDVHYADIAEIFELLEIAEVVYIIKIFDKQKSADALAELDEDIREGIIENLSEKEIAENIEELDSDDATDIISELTEERQERVFSQIKDTTLAEDIKELLKYEENTAGGLMAKELVKVNENLSISKCLDEIRKQAKNVSRVHSIYVIDSSNKLKGRLSLKDLVTAKARTRVKDIYIPKVDYVNVNLEGEEVAKVMSKYDLEAIPVVNNRKILLGRITIDDIVDLIKEEAEKDYQLAAGITQDVDVDDSIYKLSWARLPWLFLGLLGGIGAAALMGGFEEILFNYPILFYFTPLIAAMAGNVGVQSSAIIVQGLANDDIKDSVNNRLFKETVLSVLNGIILAAILFVFIYYWDNNIDVALAISISLVAVIIVAGIVGTFIPLFLNKRGIDPAIATGPFITTSNDIFGILIYFMVAKTILQF